MICKCRVCHHCKLKIMTLFNRYCRHDGVITTQRWQMCVVRPISTEGSCSNIDRTAYQSECQHLDRHCSLRAGVVEVMPWKRLSAKFFETSTKCKLRLFALGKCIHRLTWRGMLVIYPLIHSWCVGLLKRVQSDPHLFQEQHTLMTWIDRSFIFFLISFSCLSARKVRGLSWRSQVTDLSPCSVGRKVLLTLVQKLQVNSFVLWPCSLYMKHNF